MGKVTDSSMRERQIYVAVEKKLKELHGEKANEFIVSPGFLRAEKLIVTNQSKYSFDVKKIGGEQVQELKLDRNDLFAVSRIGLFLTLQNSASIGNEVPQTYPNATLFVATGLTTLDLETIYNGFMTLKIANRVNIENLSNQEFRYVPSTQQAAAATKSEMNLSDATYKPATIIYLHGTMDIQITLEFPTYTGIAPQATSGALTTRLVLMLFGFLVKGAASQK